jgi:hypothetical protein
MGVSLFSILNQLTKHNTTHFYPKIKKYSTSPPPASQPLFFEKNMVTINEGGSHEVLAGSGKQKS